ncbi:stalk domain-containing protein [Paenibacillus thailandensis]|uniref:Stalk domain-containing protein n=1 Tax=Paenibacillus thailandensis TaxID=393250 RepID=A0ABW5R245_9BACL
MKKKIIAAGVVASLMLVSAGIGAYAATKMTLVVNGTVAKVDPKVIDGTTYIPVRAAAELLGATVGYDNKTNTVTITSKGASDSTTPSATTNSKSSPAAIGAKVTYKVEDILDNYTAEIKVESATRGALAWELIKGANQFNEAAPDGYEYLLAKISFKVVSNEKADASVHVGPSSFNLVSSSGKEYDSASVVEPEPALDTNLYAGASATGWVAFLVEKTDKAPLISFGTKYDGTGGAWFKTS